MDQGQERRSRRNRGTPVGRNRLAARAAAQGRLTPFRQMARHRGGPSRERARIDVNSGSFWRFMTVRYMLGKKQAQEHIMEFRNRTLKEIADRSEERRVGQECR